MPNNVVSYADFLNKRFPLGYDGDIFNDDSPLVKDMSAAAKEICEKYGVPLIDIPLSDLPPVSAFLGLPIVEDE